MRPLRGASRSAQPGPTAVNSNNAHHRPMINELSRLWWPGTNQHCTWIVTTWERWQRGTMARLAELTVLYHNQWNVSNRLQKTASIWNGRRFNDIVHWCFCLSSEAVQLATAGDEWGTVDGLNSPHRSYEFRRRRKRIAIHNKIEESIWKRA